MPLIEISSFNEREKLIHKCHHAINRVLPRRQSVYILKLLLLLALVTLLMTTIYYTTTNGDSNSVSNFIASKARIQSRLDASALKAALAPPLSDQPPTINSNNNSFDENNINDDNESAANYHSQNSHSTKSHSDTHEPSITKLAHTASKKPTTVSTNEDKQLANKHFDDAKLDTEAIKSSLSSSALTTFRSDTNSALINASNELKKPKAEYLSVGQGLGEMGKPVVFKKMTTDQKKLYDLGWKNNAFNQYVSDMISVNRSLPSIQDERCKTVAYPSNEVLPPTSVIICFHNEAMSVLLRTIHSVINRSPKNLIKEIILVDDFSDQEHLKQELEIYVAQLKIVKIIRAKEREGLIRARLLGADAATAPVLTFLDSHCECAEGWLEPLLARIYYNKQTVVCPVIDVIDDKTFEYHFRRDASAVSVGGFEWNLQFTWHAIPERELKNRKNPWDPIKSPTMAGGLFSIDRDFFYKLGTYDKGFDIWGGENLELSFKTWMCGGSLEIVPCSHVGHVFRNKSPYKWKSGKDVLRKNSVRLAEVWMDDYKKYYYDRIGNDKGDFGDISERVELRKKLKCKPFSYFLKEIYPEIYIPGESIGHGQIEGRYKWCLDSPATKAELHKPIGVYPCHKMGGNQYWVFTKSGEIRRDEVCLDYSGGDVVLFPCHNSGGNQKWIYEESTQLIKHETSDLCVELADKEQKVKMKPCNSDLAKQIWIIENFNSTANQQSNEDSTHTML